MIFALEKTAVLIENFLGAITGQAFEGRVDVDKDTVVAFLFGDDDAIVGVLDHQLQEFRVDHGAHLQAFVCEVRSVACVQKASAPFVA